MVVSLVLGSGAREHALACQLAKSPEIRKVYCMPGNSGTFLEPKCQNMQFSAEKAINAIISLKPDLVAIGPETFLEQGYYDRLEDKGISSIGWPSRTAQLETSKLFSRNFAAKYNVKSPEFAVFSDYGKASAFFDVNKGRQYFVKAQELCSGKGVFPAMNPEEGKTAAKKLLVEKFCGKGENIIVEQAISGREATIMAFFDGKKQVFMVPSTDHKRLLDSNKGPNTGGMGVIAPSPFVNEKTFREFEKTIAEPTLEGMKKENLQGKGIIYYGIMVDGTGIPFLLEYNMRFGDPECQAVLSLLDSDLFEIFSSMAEGTLSEKKVSFSDNASCTVTLATKNYPGNYKQDIHEVSGLKDAEKHAKVFHSSASMKEGKVFTTGGRAFSVTATAGTIGLAKKKAYTAISLISFDGKQYRKDKGLILVGRCAAYLGRM